MMKKTYLTSIVMIAVASYLFLHSGENENRGGNNGKTATHSDLSQERSTLEIKGFHYTERSDGHQDVNIHAERAFFRKGEKSAFLERPRVRVFLRDRKIFALDADIAEIDIKKRDIILRGNIRIRTETGYELETHSLKYFRKNRKITTPNKILIKGPDVYFESLGLIADLKDRQICLVDILGKSMTFEGGETVIATNKLLGIYEDLMDHFLHDFAERRGVRL